MSDLTRQPQSLGKRPALVVVDMSNGFTDPESPLGGNFQSVVTTNIKLLAEFRRDELPIFFTTVMYLSPSQAQVFRNRLPALDILTPKSKWVQINAALNRQTNEPVITKHWASGFFKTDLKTRLNRARADSLVITGLTTSGCVRATAIDGLQHDFKVFIPREAVGDRNMDAHHANLFDLHAKYADVVSTRFITDHLKEL